MLKNIILKRQTAMHGDTKPADASQYVSTLRDPICNNEDCVVGTIQHKRVRHSYSAQK